MYHIGIKSPRLFEKSIVSGSYQYWNSSSKKYQYRNFHSQKYQYHIGIVFFSLVVSASVSVVILQQRDHCCSHLDRVYSYKKLKISQKSIFLVSYLVSYHFQSVSVSYQYQDFKTPLVSVSYQYRDFWTCLVSVSYRYRNFSTGWYQYRIGIEKSGIEGLCWTEVF